METLKTKGKNEFGQDSQKNLCVGKIGQKTVGTKKQNTMQNANKLQRSICSASKLGELNVREDVEGDENRSTGGLKRSGVRLVFFPPEALEIRLKLTCDEMDM